MKFKDFLKKYSNLNDEFIDDFYNIYEFNENNNSDYMIDLDIVSKWLDTRKRKLKETLVKSYNKNIDYVVFLLNGPNVRKYLTKTHLCQVKFYYIRTLSYGEIEKKLLK